MIATQRPVDQPSTLALHIDLHDDAAIDLAVPEPGIVTITVRDADGDTVTIAFDRAVARRLIDGLKLLAGLRQTIPTLGRALALAGSIRIIFENLMELDKTEPDAVAQLLSSIVVHLRSWRPWLLLGGAT
jgi:hypothetical protein